MIGDQTVTYDATIDQDPDDDDPDDDDTVFKALADAGRRRLLDALFDADRRTLGELCDVLPGMTRFGVMKHLAVLEAAGLVVTHKAGRTKLHYLNPIPIREIHERWITKYAVPTVAAMVGLRQQLEQPTA